ncbi:hypothetical protein [Myxococcus sp. RHSTA-1-4]|uniref:hypothetical protein n=1 Tax=Myxococcus sp. RHSTA-1-4 TaxID=2874601 RepID=UPI001CBF634E|nr:hypothetical protein [Myxococcus sp. RHSTA-1-4]MBZ4420390.1 hypothetical protein [Myxococcus sp. RHSTA-1-4]
MHRAPRNVEHVSGAQGADDDLEALALGRVEVGLGAAVKPVAPRDAVDIRSGSSRT